MGPLARLNVCDAHRARRWPTRELAEFRAAGRGGAVDASFHYHYARLIEILGASSASSACWTTRTCCSRRCRAEAGVNRLEGVGVSEAPRGTLFHHYRVDEHGLLTWVNLLIATGQNNLAMNRTVAQVARHYIAGRRIRRGGAEPHRGRHPRLRPVPVLLDARRRADAAGGAAGRGRTARCATRCGR